MQNDSLQKYLNEINDSENLSDKQILEASNGDLDTARTLLVENNLKLVTYIARQYRASVNNLDDLIGEGNCGLMLASERFDFTKGVKFATFASFYIKSKIREFIYKKNKAIAIPLGAVNKYFKIHRAEEDFKEDHGREPTIEELSSKIGVAQTQIINLKNTMGMTDSLERKVSDKSEEGTTELGHLIPDESSDFISKIETTEDIESLLDSLLHLNEREQYIINSRFGLNGEKTQTLDEIGAVFNLTKERVRQVQETALSKLKLMLSSNNQMGRSKSSLVQKETAHRKESRSDFKYKCPPKRISKSKNQEEYWDSLKGERFSPTSI